MSANAFPPRIARPAEHFVETPEGDGEHDLIRAAEGLANLRAMRGEGGTRND